MKSTFFLTSEKGCHQAEGCMLFSSFQRTSHNRITSLTQGMFFSEWNDCDRKNSPKNQPPLASDSLQLTGWWFDKVFQCLFLYLSASPARIYRFCITGQAIVSSLRSLFS